MSFAWASRSDWTCQKLSEVIDDPRAQMSNSRGSVEVGFPSETMVKAPQRLG
jgi:hypothetical protein